MCVYGGRRGRRDHDWGRILRRPAAQPAEVAARRAGIPRSGGAAGSLPACRGDGAGPAVDALVLPLTGAGTALGAMSVRMLGNVIITWLRARTSPVDVTVRRADGARITLNVADVRSLPADGVARLLDELTERIGSVPAGEDAGGSDAGGPDAGGPAPSPG